MAFLSSKLGNGPLLDHGPKEEILRYNIALWKIHGSERVKIFCKYIIFSLSEIKFESITSTAKNYWSLSIN